MFAFDTLVDRTTFVVGNGKNSGKTTFLNLAAAHLRRLGPVALATVGVDGEASDQIFGHPKPCVPLAAGDLVLTTDGALRASTGAFALVHVFPFTSVLGRVVVARALRDATVELVGPGANARLGEALAVLRGELGARTVLVDGAVDRVTQVALPAEPSADPNAPLATAAPLQLIEILRIAPDNRAAALARLALLAQVLTLGPPPADLDLAGPGVVVLPGALTDTRLAALPADRRAVVVADFTRLFVSASALARLGCPLYLRRVIPVAAVVVNAFDVDEDALVRALAGGPLAARLCLNPFKERGRAADPR